MVRGRRDGDAGPSLPPHIAPSVAFAIVAPRETALSDATLRKGTGMELEVLEMRAAVPAGGAWAWRRVAASALPALVITAAFAHTLATSWRKWGNIFVDGGRELELPRRLLQGEALYSDLRCYYGPLAPYVNAALYGLFGVHADVLVAAGIASAALMTLVLYLLARRFVDRPTATVAALVFVYVCAFPHLGWNPAFTFALPYSYAATYGSLVATTSLLFLIRHAQGGRTADFVASTAFLVLASLAKVELFVAAGAAHVAWIAGAIGANRFTRARLVGYGIAAATVVAVYGLLTARVGWTLWLDNLGGPLNVANERFRRWVMGLDDPALSLRHMGASAVALAVAGGVGAAAALVAGAARARALVRWIACAAAFGATLELYRRLPLAIAFRILPLVAAAALVAFAVAAWRTGGDRARMVPRLPVWAFALASFARIPLNSTVEHYGFFLLPVPIVAFALLLLDDLPRLATASEWRRRAYRSAGAGLLVGAAVLHFGESAKMYDQHIHELATPRGRLLLLTHFEAGVVQALSSFPRGTRVLTVPQGDGLVFFSGLEAADGMFSHLPPDFVGAYAEERVLARWQANPPDVVVWTRQDMSEFGFREFGDDFARACASWLAANYSPLAGDPTAPVRLLVRKP